MSLSTMNVTKQFAIWANEEKSFRAAAARADSKREAIASQLSHLRSCGARLSVESRQASNALGAHQGHVRALQENQDTLQQQLKEERVQLEDCARETTAMAEATKQEKRAFCMEMEALNEELLNLLQNQEESGLERLITIDSVTKVLVRDNAITPNNNDNSQDPSLNDAIAQLEQSTVAYEVVQQELDTYRAYREKLRTHVLATHQPPLTEADLDALERMWVQHGEHPPTLQPTSESVHNELFYNKEAAVQSDPAVSNEGE